MTLFRPLPSWPFGSLRPHAFNLVLADAPWHIDLYSENGVEKSAQAHYETMDLAEIQALPVCELSDIDCLLLHWVIAPMLPEGIETMKGWGFTYRSFIHWRKVFPSGKPAMGTGYRVRTMGELCLIGTKGNPHHKPFPGCFDGIRREHSRKPESLFDLIDKCCPRLTRRAELFSRQSRDGWETWGRESTKFDGGSANVRRSAKDCNEPGLLPGIAA